MDRVYKWFVFLLIFLLTASGDPSAAFADNDDCKEKHRYQKRERRHSARNVKRNMTIAINPTYAENCGACHIAYQPGLLPSGSWDKILDDLSDHFGESIELNPESTRMISEYLKANAANSSSEKLSAKIMRSLGSQEPLRITEVPYIQRKHHEIQQNVLDRKAIGSLSNCAACHTTAENWIYDDDYIAIPR